MSQPTGLKRLSKIGMIRRVESSADIDDSVVPTTNEEITLWLRHLYRLKKLSLKLLLLLLQRQQLQDPRIEGWLFRSQLSSEFHKRQNLQVITPCVLGSFATSI
ncbi:hypothetical protein Tco_0305796, partial [Tanacetum coccineum]